MKTIACIGKKSRERLKTIILSFPDKITSELISLTKNLEKLLMRKILFPFNNYPRFDMSDFKSLNGNTGWQNKVPEYIKNYVNLNTFMERVYECKFRNT